MKLQLLTRRGLSYTLGCIVVGFGACLLWQLSRPPGPSYFFPEWSLPEVLDHGAHDRLMEARLAELEKLEESTPIILDAFETRPSLLGSAWTECMSRLPDSVARLLPRYDPDRRETAGSLIGTYCNRPAVALGTVRRWNQWDDARRMTWLSALPNGAYTQRVEFVPLLESLTLHTNQAMAMTATSYLLDYGTLRESTLGHVAALIRRVGPRLQARVQSDWAAIHILEQLASRRELPDPVVEAVNSLLNPERPGLNPYVLLSLATQRPSRPIDRALWDESVRGLSAAETKWLIYAMRGPGFRTAAADPCVVGWLMRLAFDPASWAPSKGVVATPPPGVAAAETLELLGPAAASRSWALVEHMHHTNHVIRLWAARVFACGAPGDPVLVQRIAPLLTNSATVAPLLLWLASIGTNGLPAAPEVARIACNQIRFERPLRRPDPRVTAPSKVSAPVVDAAATVMRLPARIRLDPDESCPSPLRSLWPIAPGKGATNRDEARRRRVGWAERDTFEFKSLDELAVMTLSRMLPQDPSVGALPEASGLE